ncbi:MAG: hypothetical protein ABI239_06465 [Aquihabitans sp.]
MAIAIGCVLLAGALLVRGTLLDDAVYTGALARADVYERLYTEVLADPELAEITEEIVGQLELEGVDPAEARTLATNALRWAVPPSLVRAGSEEVITETLAYLRGDQNEIIATVDLSVMLDRVEQAVIDHARTAMASMATKEIRTVEEYRTAVEELVALVAEGRIPDTLPVPGGDINGRHVVEVLTDVALSAGADPLTVETLSKAGSDREALVVASTEALRSGAKTARRELEAKLDDGYRFDIIDQLSQRQGDRRSQVVDQLNKARDLMALFGTWTLAGGAVLLILGSAALVALHRDGARRLSILFGSSLVAGGVLTLLVWWSITRSVGSPLAAGTGTGPGTWNLPGGLRSVIGDVEGNLVSSFHGDARRLAFLPLVAGGALAGIAAIHVRRAVTIGLVVAVGATAVAWVAVPAADNTDGCNGHVELCDRGYDEVAYAATHNSMSSPDVVRVWPEQDETIREQLDGGIRALLIDTHHWTRAVSPEQIEALSPNVPPAVVASVMADRDLTRGRPGTFLCHNHCIWGAMPFGDALGDVKDFLDENPREVVTLVIQDAISAEETEAEFVAAGLEPYLHVQDVDADWPTLGQLIDRDERLVVFSEFKRPPPAWYHEAFEFIQDTPYLFPTKESLSCEAGRGHDDNRLFMINHWLSALTPDRSNAAAINGRQFIVDRARQCEEERGQMANFIAVDFAGIGDVQGAVDELNGLTGR